MSIVCPPVFVKRIPRRQHTLDERIGFGAGATGGTIPLEITSLKDSSLFDALMDYMPWYIYFTEGMVGTWTVPHGSHTPGANKTIDGKCANIEFQFGHPNNELDINDAPAKDPPKVGQFGLRNGNFMMTDITLTGDLGWPYTYEAPYFKNGPTDGFEIWDGKHYHFRNITVKRMSDESLSVYHWDGSPDLITFANIKFLETKTGSLMGRPGNYARGRVSLIENEYNEMVNGRAPGEVRNMDVHAVNNVIRYVNDEGYKVGINGRVVSEYNVFDIGCNNGVSGPRTIRYIIPDETPSGVLWSDGDIVDPVATACPYTIDTGYIGSPTPKPFNPDYTYTTRTNRADIENHVAANAGRRDLCPEFC